MLTSRFEDALLLASDLHRQQKRRTTQVPYMAHLMGVSALALEATAYHEPNDREAIAIGALLHDAIEDQGDKVSLAEIESRFGPFVAQIVSECTDTDVVPKPPWKARKEKYIADIKNKARASQLVSTADKLHNARAILFDYQKIGMAVFDRFSVPAHEVVWYYQALCEAFEKSWPDNPLLKELRIAVNRIAASATGN